MFGIAFALAFYTVLFVLLKIVEEVSKNPADFKDFSVLGHIVAITLSVVLGIMVQKGLENAIRKHSRHYI